MGPRIRFTKNFAALLNVAYYTLIASLPHMPAHFDVPRPPITRMRLEQRLTMLSEEDTETLQQLLDFLAWDRQPTDQTDEEVVQHYHQLRRRIHHPLIWQIVEQRIDLRTIVSALRRRRRGEGPPEGVGELVDPIRRRWQEPFFGLLQRHPWIEGFQKNMESGDAMEAERILYESVWVFRCRMAAEFTFSFEAVLLYLARWSIVDRWTSRDGVAGRARFDQLIEETLGKYATIDF